jgi:hypothetical protein
MIESVPDRDSLYASAIAEKIEKHPELLEVPSANIDRWLLQKHSAPGRLEQWRMLIVDAKLSFEGMKRLLGAEQSEEAKHFRSFSPLRVC